MVDQYSAAQCAFAVGYVGILALWAYAEYLELRASDAMARVYETELNEITATSPLGAGGSSADTQQALENRGGEKKDDEGSSSAAAAAAGAGGGGGAAAQEGGGVPANSSSSSSASAAVDIPVPLPPSPSSTLSAGAVLRSVVSTNDNPVWNMVRMHPPALLSHRLELRDAAEFGAHLCFYFFCDRTSVMPPPGEKHYSRDLFWFVYAILIAYNVAHYVEKTHAANYLNRDQTEEWKGWMQILFLMYHYFNAGEQYNSIRLYIAAYVWMTGFGNFSFYYVRKDFSPARFFQMLWRLNFLVFWVCVVMNNDYMLYYICPMHTIWTIFVYLVLLIGREHNNNQMVIGLKVLVSLAIVTAGWYSVDFFYTMWEPFSWLVQYADPQPKKVGTVVHPLHEWFFRSGLDRYVWIFGMLCANFHPTTEKFLVWMDNLPRGARFATRATLASALGVVAYFYCVNVFFLPKREYNALHPYTSWVPILVYILMRNLTPTLRAYSLTYFAFLGKITLETYIGQFHIWLHTGVPNGQPRSLLTIIPDYPVCDGSVFILSLFGSSSPHFVCASNFVHTHTVDELLHHDPSLSVGFVSSLPSHKHPENGHSPFEGMLLSCPSRPPPAHPTHACISCATHRTMPASTVTCCWSSSRGRRCTHLV